MGSKMGEVQSAMRRWIESLRGSMRAGLGTRDRRRVRLVYAGATLALVVLAMAFLIGRTPSRGTGSLIILDPIAPVDLPVETASGQGLAVPSMPSTQEPTDDSTGGGSGQDLDGGGGGVPTPASAPVSTGGGSGPALVPVPVPAPVSTGGGRPAPAPRSAGRASAHPGSSPTAPAGPPPKASQTITFPQPKVAEWAPDVAVPLRATASSGLAVQYAFKAGVPNDGCVLKGDIVTSNGSFAPNSCVIVASQPGDGQYLPASDQEALVKIVRGRAELSFPKPNPGTQNQFDVTVKVIKGQPLNVSLESADPAVCSLGEIRVDKKTVTATVTAHQAGICSIQATGGSGDFYDDASPKARQFPVDPRI